MLEICENMLLKLYTYAKCRFREVVDYADTIVNVVVEYEKKKFAKPLLSVHIGSK